VAALAVTRTVASLLFGRHGDRVDVLERHLGDELDGVDRAFGGDAETRQDAELVRMAGAPTTMPSKKVGWRCAISMPSRPPVEQPMK